MTIQLRPYQREAVDATYRWLGSSPRNPLVVVPTGGGKSVIIASFLQDLLANWPRLRVLCLTHVRELVAQNAAKMLAIWPGAPVGILSAGLKRRETDHQIVFAGIQSSYRRADLLGWRDLVLIDECHLVPRSGEGMYRTLLGALGSINQNIKVVGYTATAYRTDTGLLHEGDGALFGGIAYDCDMVRLIREGYLAPLIPKQVTGQIDTHGVHKQAGDFKAGELEAAALAGDRVPLAIAEMLRWGRDRRAWLVFGCGVEHCERVAELLQRAGIPCACVFGHTPTEERDSAIARYKSGELRALVNYGVLTTGFDAPATDLLAILRPTCSPGLFVQMCGRGMRPADGKQDCLVLDFGGNVQRHGPIDMIKPKTKDQGSDGTAPVKTCPNCKTIVFAGLRECLDCGYEWPKPEPKHDVVAHTHAVIAGLAEPEMVQVVGTRYSRHDKPGKAPTMRVDYLLGPRGIHVASEWVAFEASGYARQKAEEWWIRSGGSSPFPRDVGDAIERRGELQEVTRVRIRQNGRYWNVLSRHFDTPPDRPRQDQFARVARESLGDGGQDAG